MVLYSLSIVPVVQQGLDAREDVVEVVLALRVVLEAEVDQP